MVCVVCVWGGAQGDTGCDVWCGVGGWGGGAQGDTVCDVWFGVSAGVCGGHRATQDVM